jgi:hypothetical protein
MKNEKVKLTRFGSRLKGLSPAMAPGLSDTLWSMKDMAEMIDANLPKPGKRGPYKRQVAA